MRVKLEASMDIAMSPRSLARYLPILDWCRRYNRQALSSDLLAAAIVTIMLVPQSLAYAMLAGLPPETGIYASIAPIVLYALFGYVFFKGGYLGLFFGDCLE